MQQTTAKPGESKQKEASKYQKQDGWGKGRGCSLGGAPAVGHAAASLPNHLHLAIMTAWLQQRIWIFQLESIWQLSIATSAWLCVNANPPSALCFWVTI